MAKTKDVSIMGIPVQFGCGKTAIFDMETVGLDHPLFPDTSLVFDSPPCEDFSRPNRVTNTSFRDGPDGWSRLARDMRSYDVPASVDRGFTDYLGREPALTADMPEPFHLEPWRYSSANGRAFDMPAMMRDIDAATRAGRPIIRHTEMPVR